MNLFIDNTGAAPTDPDFASVVLLLHLDGVNASTTFTDNSLSAHTVGSIQGNVQITTAQSQFGGASGTFDGSGDYFSYADSTDWTFGSGDFTVECWSQPASATGLIMMGQVDSVFTNAKCSWLLFSTTSTAGVVKYSVIVGQSTSLVQLNSTNSYAVNTWHHVAAVRHGTSLMIFVDGVLDGSTTLTGAINDSAQSMGIGQGGEFTGSQWSGQLDDIRITKGVARYTGSTYTVPTAAFPNS